MDGAAAVAQRGFDRIGQAGAVQLAGDQAVHHRFDGVAPGLFQPRQLLFVELHDIAVDPGAHKSLRADRVEDIAVFALAPVDERGEDHHLLAGLQREQLFGDRLRRLGLQFAPAVGTVRHADMGVEQTQIVVDFGYGRNGGARRAAGGALFDRDRGRKSFDVFDLRLLHPVEELPRIG